MVNSEWRATGTTVWHHKRHGVACGKKWKFREKLRHKERLIISLLFYYYEFINFHLRKLYCRFQIVFIFSVTWRLYVYQRCSLKAALEREHVSYLPQSLWSSTPLNRLERISPSPSKSNWIKRIKSSTFTFHTITFKKPHLSWGYLL